MDSENIIHGYRTTLGSGLVLLSFFDFSVTSLFELSGLRTETTSAAPTMFKRNHWRNQEVGMNNQIVATLLNSSGFLGTSSETAGNLSPIR